MNRSNSLVLIFVAALGTVSAVGQNAPIIREGVTEVGGFVGASYGVDQARVMGGGNVVYSLTRIFMPFGEISYFPGVGHTQTVPVTGFGPVVEHFSIPLADFNAGFHVRIPIPKSRIIPYGVASVGGIHSLQRMVTGTYTNPDNASQIVTTSPFQAPGGTAFAVSGGAGLRYYATERWGFRAEFKGYRPTANIGLFHTPAFYRVAFGFFYQF